ncbi:somatostatin receptor type 5 [Syngnathus scovelli]|uniref:somatostatin receptor type 5 n=1 Tax=Syngnathus scovelli TaxID=161590 RepID=UPI0035CA9016
MIKSISFPTTTISFNVVLPLVSLVSLLWGLVGHLLLWLVLIKNPRSRSKPTSLLLLNLSLADMGALLTLPCVLLSAAFQDWQLGDASCILLGFMTSITVGVEIFSLATLSVLRYHIVAPGTRWRRVHTQRPLSVPFVVVAIWLVSVAMALPKLTYIDFNGGCTWSVGRDDWLFFLIPAFLVYYVGPLLCIAVNCGLIISHLHGYRGSLAAHRRNKKATALLIASTLVFMVSWLPYYALEFVNVMSPHISSVASPHTRFRHEFFTPSYLLVTTLGPSIEMKTNVSLLWEVSSLTAILLVCLAPCWNPPLYFLLSRPAVRQLRALLPSFFRQRHPSSQISPVPCTHWQPRQPPVTESLKVKTM